MRPKTQAFLVSSCQPAIIMKGDNRKATDTILAEHRENESAYKTQLCHRNTQLEIVEKQQDAMNNMFFEIVEHDGIEISKAEIAVNYDLNGFFALPYR